LIEPQTAMPLQLCYSGVVGFRLEALGRESLNGLGKRVEGIGELRTVHEHAAGTDQPKVDLFNAQNTSPDAAWDQKAVLVADA
jgi:hypothetical protein